MRNPSGKIKAIHGGERAPSGNDNNMRETAAAAVENTLSAKEDSEEAARIFDAQSKDAGK